MLSPDAMVNGKILDIVKRSVPGIWQVDPRNDVQSSVTPDDDSPISPKVALITGGARRIGREVALRLAGRGWDIAITYLSSDDAAAELAESIQRLGRQCQIVRADFSDPETASASVADAIMKRFDRLDLLLHNASVYEPTELASINSEALRFNFAVHCETPVLLTKLLAGHLRESGGTVLTMTDTMLDRTRQSFLAYSLSKAAAEQMTRELARSLAPEVTVNAIAPGAILWAEEQDEHERQQYLSRVPMGKRGEPADIAALVEFLCTDGKYITGQTIRVDGGRSLR